MPDNRSVSSDRIAIVTGANHGIGAATAVALAARGVAVLATYLRFDEPHEPTHPEAYADDRRRTADDVVERIVASGGRAVAAEVDLADPEVLGSLFDRAEAELGPVDILINNASGWAQDSFGLDPTDRFGRTNASVTAASFEQNFAVDARASALLIAEFAHRHIAGARTWGRIVGLTSGGPNGFPGETSYGAAKAAQENYTMTAATELALYGVTANIVYPPVTDTGWVTDDVRGFVAASADHHHVASPGDVAKSIVWLCSDDAYLVTGNIIRLR